MEYFEHEIERRFSALRRETRAETEELELHVLEAIAAMRARIRELEARQIRYEQLEDRITKLEENPLWKILVEEAQKLKMTPEQFLKRMITDYLKRKEK